MLEQVSGGLSEWWSERFNRFDLPAMLFGLLSIMYMHGDGLQAIHDSSASSSAARSLRAFAAFFMWMRMQRVLLVFSRFGPGVFSVFVMLEDVITYLVLLLIFPIAFAALLVQLLEPPSSSSSLNTQWLPVYEMHDPDCADHFQGFPNAFIFLLEQAMSVRGARPRAHASTCTRALMHAHLMAVLTYAGGQLFRVRAPLEHADHSVARGLCVPHHRWAAAAQQCALTRLELPRPSSLAGL